MICRACLRRAPALIRQAQTLRPFSISAAARSAVSAESTQPPSLSTPLSSASDATSPTASKLASGIESSCPAGTTLSGLNYFKGRSDPVALADEEYPEWLWSCLDVQKKAETADEGLGDEFSKSKKQRRLAAKRQKQREEKLLAEGNLEALAPKIPLQQQSINLPGDKDGDVEHNLFAAEKREELRKAMRKERKAKIKETNYLKSM